VARIIGGGSGTSWASAPAGKRARVRASARIGLYVITCLAAAACARTRRTPDDTLVFLLEAQVKELDPRFLSGSNEEKLSRLVAPGLTSVDQASLEPRMELASEITPVDELTWTVTLRDDARFPDGDAVTAADVVWTYRTILDRKNRSGYFQQYDERFAAVEEISPRQVRFRLKKPLGTFVTDLEMGILSAKAGRAGHVVGAGPYALVSLEPEEVLLERNPHYHGGLPPTRFLRFKVLVDQNARLTMLIGGSADLSQNTVRLDQVGIVAARERLKISSSRGAVLRYLLMRNDAPHLSDWRVRRAIAFAVDRQKLIARKLGGHAVVATGLIPPGHWAYSDDIERFDHDPEAARRLLDEAGLADPEGPAPRFRLSFKVENDSFRLAIARSIAQDLRAVGIEVDIRSFEFATLFTDLKSGLYELAMMQTSMIVEPDMYYHHFHSARIPTKEFPNLANRWRYRSAEADELIERGRRTAGREARREIYARLQKLLSHDMPIVPLWHEDNVAVMNVDVDGYEVLPNARLAALSRAAKKR
jgi:peptide/nickel transport system substrate-binding protein